jgi:D-serine deaminase-like pyridoxal phosphate-dependent protein
MNLDTAPTPALVLELDKLRANCARMLELTARRGCRLRPHMKTLKSIEAARLAIDPSHGGIAVSTLNEAEYFARAGISDIQLAVCLPPARLPWAAELSRRAPGLSLFIDDPEVAAAVADFAARHDADLRVWIEIDSGERRTGLLPDDPALLDTAAILARAPGVRLEGVATHGGHSYNVPAGQIAEVAEAERLAVAAAAGRLRQAGFEVPGVSAGSSPTAAHGRSAEGLTEIRAGVYMAGDLFQAGVGVLDRDEIAVWVLATVISHSRARGQLVVDAGGLALSKDRSTAVLPGLDAGYGEARALDGAALGLIVDEVYQEHGEIHGCPPGMLERLPVGSRLRILPNHACMTAAMYDHYLVVDAAGEVVDRWGRTNGWSPLAEVREGAAA